MLPPILRATGALLLAAVLAACGAPGAQPAANPSSIAVPTAAALAAPTQSPALAATAPPAAPAAPKTAPSAVPNTSGWRQLGQLQPGSAAGLTIAALALDPTTPATLYVGTLYTADNRTGVYRSGDGGATWQPAGQSLPTSSDGTGVEQLTIDPQHPATIYATGHFAGVWRSDDQGGSWRATGLKDGSVGALALDPRAPATLYALTGDGLQRSPDGGASWQLIGAGLPGPTDVAFRFLRIDPQQPDTLYLGTNFGGVFRSADAGQHWSAANTDLPDQPVLDGLALDPQHPGTLYVSITGAGLYRSTDGGQHWHQASDQGYLAVTPAAGDALYALLNGALVRSSDRGATWQTVAGVTCGVQALAPAPSGGVLAGCLDGGVYMLPAPQLAVSPSPQPVSAVPTVVTAPASADAKTAVLAAAHALGQAGPYHITGTISSAGATSQIADDVVPPDRLHSVMNTPDGTVEFITIGEQNYTKAKGRWIAVPTSASAVLQNVDPLGEALLQTITDVALVGTDSVDGVAAQVYTYTARTDDLSSTAKLWISTANGLPIKIESDGQVGGTSTHGTETITYDPDITIEAPIP